MKNKKLYFLCPTNKFVTGGVKQIYKMVQILNENGFNAVLLLKKNKKEKWFDANVPIEVSPYLFKRIKYSYKEKNINLWQKLVLNFLKMRSTRINNDSILVFPEIYGSRIQEIEPQIKKVIFNQNCYYTFNQFNLEEIEKNNPYKSEKINDVIVASRDAEQYLKYSFPHLKIHKLTIGINEKVFNLGKDKKKQIVFMPRKLGEDVLQVLSIFKSREKNKDWNFVAIDGKTEMEVAKIFKESVIFLSFNHKEGFGLPPVEAMACGCYVIGYQGQAGKEYFNEEFSTSVPDGNIISFCEEIEKTLETYNYDKEIIINKGKLASEFVLKKYSLENEKSSTINIWTEILFK